MSNVTIKKNFFTKLKDIFKPVDLTKGTIWKVILQFTLPIIISYLLQQLYVLSDAAIVGQNLSADEVAGVNDTSSIIFIFMQFAFGCTAGFCVILCNKIGALDEDGIRKSFATQIILCSIITVVLTILAILSINPLLKWVNVTKDNLVVYNAAYTYCYVIFLGLVAQLFYNFILSVLRSIGDSFTPLLFLFISTFLNIILDVLFIKNFKMGVAGAAIATVLTQILCTIGCFIYTFKKYPYLKLSKKDFKISTRDVTSHLKQGIPLGLQFSVLSIGLIVMLAETVKFDLMPNGMMVALNPAQNGMGAASKLINFAMAPLSALGTAMVSYNAQNLGAKNYLRVKNGTNQALIISIILYVICSGISLLLSINGAYQYIFLSADKITEQSIRFGNAYLYVDLPLFIILGFLFVLRNSIQGIGKSVWTLLAGAGELVARVVICSCLPQLINNGPINSLASYKSFVALCFGDPGAWAFAVFFLLIPYFKNIIKMDYKYVETPLLKQL